MLRGCGREHSAAVAATNCAEIPSTSRDRSFPGVAASSSSPPSRHSHCQLRPGVDKSVRKRGASPLPAAMSCVPISAAGSTAEPASGVYLGGYDSLGSAFFPPAVDRGTTPFF